MFKSGIGMMLVILVSRLLGFVRAFAIAYYFGATALTDAYYSAFKISNFFRQLLGEGALGNAFIPLYNEKISVTGEEEGKKYIFSIINLVFLFSIIIFILTFIYSGNIIRFTVRGFDVETQEMASMLLKIMSIYFVFIALSGIIGAVLNNYKKFIVPASTGIFFNLAIIASAYFASKTHGIKALGYGVVVAGLLQFLVVLPSFFKIVKTYSFKIDWKDEYLRKTLVMILPMLVGIFAIQINTIVDQYFASFLDTGGVSAIENATRIYNLPIGVFGITVSTIIFPILSKAIVNKEYKEVRDNFTKGLNILLFLVIPAMGVFTFFARDVIELTLGYGKFTENDVYVTSQCLMFYSLGLYFYVSIHLLTRGFYGNKDSKTPVKFSILSITINIILNRILIGHLSFRGLALSTAIAAMVNFSCLLYTYNKKYSKLSLKRVRIFAYKVLFTTLIAIIISSFIENSLLKLLAFSGIYMTLWGREIYRKKMNLFLK